MSPTSNTDEESANDTMIYTANYSQESWSNTSPRSKSPYDDSPMGEYGHFDSYIIHNMTTEPISGLPTMSHEHQPQLIQAGGPMTHQQLPMLSTGWPSEMISHIHPGSYSIAPKAVDMRTTVPREPKDSKEKIPRRTLTFAQKQAMCLYHAENPKAKQMEIGKKFGVERSTVSKVLRNKESFLKGDTEKETNGRRVVGKYPDLDRTLSVYIKKQRELGREMTDEAIMEKAKRFAGGSGHRDTIMKSLTHTWLQKFKQRYSIGTSAPMRRASEPRIPALSTSLSSISPSLPSAQTSPLSGSRSDEDMRAHGEYSFAYRQASFQSETPLTGTVASSFSSDIVSPVGPFGFSPDASTAVFPLDPKFSHEEKLNGVYATMQAQYLDQKHHTHGCATPRNHPSALVQDVSPTSHEMTFLSGADSTKETGKAAARLDGAATPSSEDAQRAAITLLNYLQNLSQPGQFEGEYSAIMKLTKKLDIQPSKISSQ